MRKKKLLSLLLAGAQLAAIMSTAVIPASAAITYTDTMNITKTGTAPTIDGDLSDATWNMTTLPAYKNASATDTAKYDVKWDDSYLYIAVSVENDAKIVAGTDGVGNVGSWGGGDGVRLFFDPDMNGGEKAPSVGDLDFKPVLPKDGKSGNALILYDNTVAADASAIMNSIKGKNADYKCKVSTSSWSIEMRIDWKDLRVTPSIGKAFGFNLQICNEIEGSSIYHVFTDNGKGNTDEMWHLNDYNGKAVLADLPASGFNMDATKVTTAPTIDGQITEWGTLSQTMASGAQGKDRATFDVKYDDQFLYIAAKVTNHTGSLANGTTWEEGDCISIYFDPTMHRGTLNNAVYDLQIGYGYSSAGTPTILFGGSPASSVTNDINSKGLSKCTAQADGWTLETKLPLSALHIDKPYFGFNVQVENNPASTFINWADGSDFWQSTSQYGKITLKRPAATSLTSTTTSLDIPKDTSTNLSDIKFVLDGNKNIDGTFYDMKVAFDPAGIVAVESGKLVGKAVGTTNITFSVDDKKVVIPATVKAVALITIDPIADQSAYVGFEKSLTVTATSSSPTTLVYAAEGLPTGATFNADTHTLKWTPTADQKGDHNITFTVGDKDSTKRVTVKFTVNETPAITIKPIDNKTTAYGAAVSFIFDVKDSLGLPLTGTCDNLPAGARFTSNSGTYFFTWIPTKTQIGTHDLKFNFTNGVNQASTNVKITVTDKVAEGISFVSVPNRTVTAGEAIQYTVSASSSTGKPVSYTVISMPNGATFDKDTHIVSWVTNSTHYGTYTFKVEATDGTSTAQQVVTVTVNSNDDGGSSRPSYGGGGGGGYIGNTGNASGTTTGTGSAAQPSTRFKDMENYQWASESVDFLAEYGIINGVTKDTFEPGRNISRADFVILLMRTFKFSSDTTGNFSDVATSDYFAKEVATAKAIGLVTGSGANKFNPKAPITREDMMVMLNRALKLAGLVNVDANQQVLSNYNDTATISDYATSSVANLVSNNLIAGSDGNIKPSANTTRAEVSVIIHRMFLKYGSNLL